MVTQFGETHAGHAGQAETGEREQPHGGLTRPGQGTPVVYRPEPSGIVFKVFGNYDPLRHFGSGPPGAVGGRRVEARTRAAAAGYKLCPSRPGRPHPQVKVDHLHKRGSGDWIGRTVELAVVQEHAQTREGHLKCGVLHQEDRH